MTELDRLPPDQRAVLSLVLDRGKSYGEVAEMLGIAESTVRERAHAALDALASYTPVPSFPSKPSGIHEARPSLSAPSSRTGGALLLGGIVAVIVVVVVVLLTSGGGGGAKSSSTSSTGASSTSSSGASSTTAATTAGASKAKLDKTIALTPLEPSLKQNGTAYVLSQNGRSAFYISAQGLPPSSAFFYAVWLYNSPSSSAPLGRAPTVGSNGVMQGGNPLPSNAGLYHQLIVTRETSTHPTHPGPIVLRGTFALR